MERELIMAEVEKYLRETGIIPEYYHHKASGKDYIKLPAKDVLINANVILQNAGKDNLQLSEHFSSLGFNMIQVWEDQWITHREVVKSRLKALAGRSETIHGRETNTSRISAADLLYFLKENHINVPIKGKYKYGLFKNDLLVSVASFSYPRNFTFEGRKVKSYELLRFCHLKGHTVVGGLSKLIKHFVREKTPGHIMTYIDREWGSGDGFIKTGFKSTGNLEPRAVYINKEDFIRHYPSNKSANFINEAGFVKIYNCGSIKMEWFENEI